MLLGLRLVVRSCVRPPGILLLTRNSGDDKAWCGGGCQTVFSAPAACDAKPTSLNGSGGGANKTTCAGSIAHDGEVEKEEGKERHSVKGGNSGKRILY